MPERFQVGWYRTLAVAVSERRCAGCWIGNRFADTTPAGWIPFLGYHHVLMILIAVALILLCERPAPFPSSVHGQRELTGKQQRSY